MMVPPYLKTMRTLEALLAVMLLSTCSLSGCTFLETPDGSTEVTAIFSLTPSSNVQVGQEVEVDASSSLPSDGSLTYRWDFDGDGQSDESGVSATWTYLEAEEVTIELTVSDGTNRDTRSVDLTIFEASVSPPTADAGSGGSEADCDEESIDSTTYYLVYLCEMDQSSSDRNVDGTVDVALDGSGSTSRNTGGYVSRWAWDLDLQTDTDGDGDTENDADLTGERPTWQGVQPGEYDIALTVEDENGMTAKDEVTVFVNYVGLWSDMDIGPNRTSGAPTIEFTFPVAYDRDSGNTIRKAEFILSYPEQDDDWIVGSNSEQNRNRLDLHAQNEDGDDVRNTTDAAPDDRNAGDCDEDEDDCVLLLLSSFMFSDTQHGDGEWTVEVKNERRNDVTDIRVRIDLVYK